MKNDEELILTDSDILAITECYRIYMFLDDDCKSRVPKKFLDFLKKYKDLSVGTPLHLEIPLTMQDISKEGWNLIAAMGDFLK